MKTLKKHFAVIALVTTLFTALTPKESKAGIGGLVTLFGGGVVGVPMMVVGGVVTGAGAGLVTYGIIQGNRNKCGELGCIVEGLFGIMGILGGLVILDDNSNTGANFATVTADSKAIAGLSDAEADAYNSEIEEINAIREQITVELSKAEKPSFDQSAKLWNDYSSKLSPEAFAGVQKVSKKFAETVAANLKK